MIQDAIIEAMAKLTAHERIYAVRWAQIVADQPQERALLCLKKSGSFRDCTFCLRDSRHLYGTCSANDLQEPRTTCSRDHDIFHGQLDRTSAARRDVIATASQQMTLLLGKIPAMLPSYSTLRRSSPREVQDAKAFLYRNS